MNKSELIADFINKVATGDESAKDAFSAYCSMKATAINAEKSILEKFESFKATLLEEIGNYSSTDDEEADVSVGPSSDTKEPIRMDGDRIFVNNKEVGRINVDMDNFNSGIDFVSTDGSFSKEFHTAEDLFAFISKRFLGEGHVAK